MPQPVSAEDDRTEPVSGSSMTAEPAPAATDKTADDSTPVPATRRRC